MNRAWIPAGALAGVSVAGLLALGPLTDSMGTQVKFATTIAGTPQPSPPKARNSVPVSITVRGPVGKVKTSHESEAALRARGAQASALPSTNPDAGQVGFRTSSRSSSHTSSVSHSTVTTTHKVAVAPTTKKVAKRPTSISGVSESNGDAGLAGGDSQGTSTGGQSPTPTSSGS